MTVTSLRPILSAASRTAVEGRVAELFDKSYRRLAMRNDRMFGMLMLAQWAAAVALSLWLSPLTWSGATSSVHPHVFAALLLGGIISTFPFFLARTMQGHPITRYVIAMAQVSWSALFIHLTGGRIETHFHVFGSLAMLAFYRDYKILIPATAIVAIDHFFRGLYWPESIYGVANPEWWRFLEHAAWVVFIDIFLVMNCVYSRQDMIALCERRAEIEIQQSAHLEAARRVSEQRAIALAERARNEAVESAYAQLSDAHAKLHDMQQQLVAASRQAGMAEIATTVLHNVGNAMNSINVSTQLVRTSVMRLKMDRIGKIAALLDEHRDNLGEYLAEGERGSQIISLLQGLTAQLDDRRATANKELDGLARHVEHVKAVVRSQQEAAKMGGVVEDVALPSVIDDALQLVQDSLDKHGITVVREEVAMAEVPVDRHRLLQIIANLVGNAAQALRSHDGQRQMRICVHEVNTAPQIVVTDSGPGVPAAIGDRIFQYGFTTKRDGHGFGLHASALLAGELGGELRLQPPVEGEGATFVLTLPHRLAKAS